MHSCSSEICSPDTVHKPKKRKEIRDRNNRVQHQNGITPCESPTQARSYQRPKDSPGSNTRIILLNARLFRKTRPAVASICQASLVGQRSNLIIPLYELKRKTLTRVPPDVAVHKPGTRIISLECKDKISASWQHSRIPAWRVTQVEGNG
jgi:hypothetical protein